MSIQDPLIRPGFLKSRGAPVWVIVTGNVRSGREFRGIFSKALKMREAGLVDGIRFVTWNGELEAAPGLERTMVDLDISILTVQPPIAEPKVHPLFHGYVYHQRKALHFGLNSLPANAYVLKARTDLAEERFDSMVNVLFRNPTVDLEVGIPDSIVETRIFSFDARPDHLFYWDDIVFSGMRDDLLKLNNFDLTCDFLYPGHNFPAECRLFAPLFLEHYPILRWFFENIDGKEFSQLLQRWLPLEKEIPLPALARNILASYLHVLSRYVLLPGAGSPPIQAIHLGSFLTPNEDLGVKSFPHPWPSHKLCRQKLLDRLRSLEPFSDLEMSKVAELIRRMDVETALRGAMPSGMDREFGELNAFAGRFGIQLFTPQTRLIPATASNPPLASSAPALENIALPEKRHLSWWQRKTTGLRRSAAEYAIRRLL